MQGGVDDEAGDDDAADEDLVSLGSLFFEPVWLFYREESAQRLLKAPHADTCRSCRAGAERRHRGSGVPR